MKGAVSVERLPADWMRGDYDIAVGAVGYESRSRHVFETLPVESRLKAAAAFDAQQVLAFDTNLCWYQENGFKVDVVSDLEYAEWFGRILSNGLSNDGLIRVIVDFSSLSRVRLARIVSVARAMGINRMTIDFVYCLAQFTPPPTDQSANTHVGPVIDEFAGWWGEPDRSLSAIVGLGYEQDKALGAVEYLEAQEVWIFQPTSVIEEYTIALESANQTLLSMTNANHRFFYRVHDPLDCFSKMQSLARGLILTSNVVLLPFGPKIIVLCALLIAASDRRISVWRVSAQETEEPVDRVGSDNFYGLRVCFA